MDFEPSGIIGAYAQLYHFYKKRAKAHKFFLFNLILSKYMIGLLNYLIIFLKYIMRSFKFNICVRLVYLAF